MVIHILEINRFDPNSTSYRWPKTYVWGILIDSIRKKFYNGFYLDVVNVFLSIVGTKIQKYTLF